MASTRKPPPSPVKTGIMHTAMAVMTFAAISAAGILAIRFTGDPNTGAPSQVVGLFDAQPTHAVGLNHRLPDDEADIHHASAETSHDTHAPNLGVADPSDHDAHGDVQTASLETHAPAEEPTPAPSTAQSHASLPVAPLPGMSQWSEHGGRLPVIAEDGRRSFDVYRRPFSNPAGRPTISIIIGGLGLNSRVTQAAIDELPPEVTLSFVPYSRGLQTWVDRARAAGHEVMIELPMEPYDYPNNDTGPYTLLTTANATETRRRTEWLLSRATGYFGVTNYQGAKFATDNRSISPVFQMLSERGLAFIHDGAAPRSVFQTVADANHLPFTEAARVIDADPTGSAIDEQLLHLEAISLQRGSALGTGFAFPITIDQIRDWAETLPSKGYLLAPASSLPRAAPAYIAETETGAEANHDDTQAHH